MIEMKTLTLMLVLFLTSMTVNASQSTTTRKYSEHSKTVMLERFDQIKGDLYHASVTAGISMAELTALGSLESKLRVKAKNPHSTAAGVLQYTNGTWKSKKKLYSKELGIKPNAHQYDVKANLLIGAKDMQETKKMLIDKTHLTNETIRLGDIYILHFVGESGGLALINSYSHKPINQIVKLHKGNSRYYYKPNGQVRTAREFRLFMDQIAQTELKVYEQRIVKYQMKQFFRDIKQVVTDFNPVLEIAKLSRYQDRPFG